MDEPQLTECPACGHDYWSDEQAEHQQLCSESELSIKDRWLSWALSSPEHFADYEACEDCDPDDEGKPFDPRCWLCMQGVPIEVLNNYPKDPDAPPDLDERVRTNFPLVDWDELWTEDDEEEWILEPLIPARRLIALFSAPKVGKSLLMLEVAVGIANGTRTLGVMPDKARRVLYVDHENDPRGDVRTRLEDMGYGPSDLKNLCYLSYPVMDGLDSALGAQQLMDAVRVYECDLVVIDTISRAVQGDENENDTWLKMFRLTGKALKRAGVAMIRLDHSGKDDSKGMRGGSAKYGDVDAVWKMTRETDTTFKLVCTDHRFQVHEKEIILTRELSPLRHRVEGGGWAALVDAKFNAAMDALADLPVDAGRNKARPILKDAGIRIGQSPLSRVLEHRKTCLDLSRTGVDHRLCPDHSRTGADRGLSG